jgi:hypothetical protein
MIISKYDLPSWLERRAYCEIVRADDGPTITVGWEPAIGSATATTGITGASAGYVSGQSSNPDAGPNTYYSGVALKDAYYRYKEGGGALVDGGYPNQALGFIENECFTASLVPSAISTTNIAALQAPTLNTKLTLANGTAGLGITVVPAGGLTVLNTGNFIPAGTLQIDAAPAWQGFGTSGAIQGWLGAAVGRAISLTSAANLAGITFVVQGYDLYGFPVTIHMAGPGAGLTVNSLKCLKWLVSITPLGTNAGTVSVGTADSYEMPLRSDYFHDMTIYWNEALITANAGYTACDTTSPATSTTGDVRGTYAVQSASDGVKRLAFYQRMGPARLNTSPPSLGMFGVPQYSGS